MWPPRGPRQPLTHSPSSRKLSTHCSTARSWSAERTSRCEGQGTASSVLRAVWMLARLPAERRTRPPPKTARLVLERGHRAAGQHSRAPGGRWDGKDEQLGEEGWDVGGGMEDAHPQGALDHARRWPWAIRAVPRAGSTWAPPSPTAPCTSEAESSGTSRSMPSSQRTGPFSGSQRIWGFLSWHSREAPPPASAKASGKAEPGWPGVAIPLHPHRDTPLAAQPRRSPRHPFPPADLGEPLTSPGWEPGSKLQARPHPCSLKWARGTSPASTALLAKGPPRRDHPREPPQRHKSLVFLGKQPQIHMLAREMSGGT